jgi:hypothetical protein
LNNLSIGFFVWRTLQRAAVGFSRQFRGERVALGHGELKFAAAR